VIGKSAETADVSIERQKLTMKNNIELGRDTSPHVQSFYQSRFKETPISFSNSIAMKEIK